MKKVKIQEIELPKPRYTDGWKSLNLTLNGRGLCSSNVSEELQEIYYNDLMNMSKVDDILTFVFEAFDEPWKGSSEPMEHEKHWSLFTVDRKPKLVMTHSIPKLI